MTMAEQIPMIGDKFKLYKTFALATTDEVFGKEALDKALHYTAKRSLLLTWKTRGMAHLKVKPLPVEAQFSCLYGMIPLMM
jgi:hypothetical protein